MSSNLMLSFKDIFTKVSEFLGLGSSPAGDNLTKAKDLAYRGYARFLLPTYIRTGTLHVWSFLKQDAIINTVSGQWEYELPSDFNYFTIGPNFSEGSNYPPLQGTTVEKIRKLRSTGDVSAYPQFWSLSSGVYSVEAGTVFNMVLYPEPSAEHQLHYQYVMEPDKPTDDGHYFIGGALVSHAILESSLAEAELQEDDVAGIHNERAKELLRTCIQQDLRRQPRDVGMVLDGRAFYNDPVLARELRWVGAPTSAYGIS